VTDDGHEQKVTRYPAGLQTAPQCRPTGTRSSAMVSVTWDEVRARRLDRLSLLERASADRLIGVTHDLGGVHAQVQTSAELQLGLRIDGMAQGDLQEALWERRLLVKAWTLRGTLHLHPAGELALWRAARRAVAGAPGKLAAWRDPAGVLHPQGERDKGEAIRAAVWDALDGRCLRRGALRGAGVGHGVPVARGEPAAASRVRRLRHGLPRARPPDSRAREGTDRRPWPGPLRRAGGRPPGPRRRRCRRPLGAQEARQADRASRHADPEIHATAARGARRRGGAHGYIHRPRAVAHR